MNGRPLYATTSANYRIFNTYLLAYLLSFLGESFLCFYVKQPTTKKNMESFERPDFDEHRAMCAQLSMTSGVSRPGAACIEHQYAYIYGGTYAKMNLLEELINSDAGYLIDACIREKAHDLKKEMCVHPVTGKAKYENLPNVDDLPQCPTDDTSFLLGSYTGGKCNCGDPDNGCRDPACDDPQDCCGEGNTCGENGYCICTTYHSPNCDTRLLLNI